MNEFLNPKSMVTPGVAGSVVMVISNALTSQFPEAPFRWVTIVLSFLVGTVVFYAVAIPMVQRVAFWAINSLIIFSVGVGTSNVAANVQRPPTAGGGAFLESLFPSAHAQPARTDVLSCEDRLAKLQAQLDEARKELASSKVRSTTTPKFPSTESRTTGKDGFFQRW